MSENNFIVRYLVTSSLYPKKASLKLCNEQSVSYSGNKKSIRKYSAKFIPGSIQVLDKRHFQVDVSFPIENAENSLSMILSAAGGDTFNIKDLHPIKILEIRLPKKIMKQCPGPKIGVEGIRKILNIYDRPILIGPVKPCVGLSPKEFGQIAKESFLGGTDIVKDDELICNPSYNSLKIRVEHAIAAKLQAEMTTGEKKLYFCFLGNGSPSQIVRKAESAKKYGVDGFMVAPAINGWEIIKDLLKFKLPVIAHNAFAYSSYTKYHGISFSIFAWFQRLCGADFVVCPAKYGTFDVMTKYEHINNIKVLLEYQSGIKKCFPAFCGGQSSRTVNLLKKDVGGEDFALIVGTALYGHHQGPRVGAKQIRQELDKS